MGRIGRSFKLVARSYEILMQDKELMVLPLLSGIIIAIVIAGVAFGFGLSTESFETRGPAMYVPTLIMYVITYGIGIFFQAAVVAGATERMRGGDPTVNSALAAAWSRIGSILMWALFAGTVGLLLKMIEERVGFLGKILTRFFGAAWALATFFIVPVLVLEEKDVEDSFRRSVSVFRETWGETMVGGASIGIVALVGWLALAAVVFLMVSMGAIVPAIVLGAIGAVTLIAFTSALHGVYVASLYRYATTEGETSGYESELMAQAFVPKR